MSVGKKWVRPIYISSQHIWSYNASFYKFSRLSSTYRYLLLYLSLNDFCSSLQPTSCSSIRTYIGTTTTIHKYGLWMHFKCYICTYECAVSASSPLSFIYVRILSSCVHVSPSMINGFVNMQQAFKPASFASQSVSQPASGEGLLQEELLVS